MGFVSRIRRRRKMDRISKVLGKPFDASDFVRSLGSGTRSENDDALEELLDFCETDDDLRKVMDDHSVDREDLQEIYKLLVANGAGQWERGYYVPVATLAQHYPLNFVLERYEEDDMPWGMVCVLLLEYFERDESGPVPREVRGPADPNDPLRAVWEMEQRFRGKK